MFIFLICCWVGIVEFLRWRRRCFLRSLEALQDPHMIAWQIAFIEFPFMFDAGTSFGFFNTFAVPSISSVLVSSKAFGVCPQVRYDDTSILMHLIGENGPRSPQGQRALARVNAIHAQFSGIKRDDMAYTLWVFAFEPQRWIAKYEWRKLTAGEEKALWRFWREVGVGLNIADLPLDAKEFEAWGREYEKEKYQYRPANRVLTDQVVLAGSRWGPPTRGSATMEILGMPQPTPETSAWVRFKTKLLLFVICALCPNPNLLVALGLEREAAAVPKFAAVVLKSVLYLRAFLVRYFLPPRPQWWPGTLIDKNSHIQTAECSDDSTYNISCPAAYLSYEKKGSFKLSELGRPASYYKKLQKNFKEGRPAEQCSQNVRLPKKNK